MHETLSIAGNLVIDVFLIATGECIRWAVTLGKHEPRWDIVTGRRPANFAMLCDPSAYVGAGFWFAAGATGLALLP